MSLTRLSTKVEAPRQVEDALANIAGAISDPSRARMLCALMDGRAWTATELSAVADIAASTASAHLTKLVRSGLLLCVSQGRHRYYRLAGSDVAGLLENMMGVSMRSTATPVSRTPVALRRARTCYDHLAGEIAVEIYAFMKREAWITHDGSSVTEPGKQQLAKLGVALSPRPRRKPCSACLDWSERQFHLGGDAGAALLIACEQKGWLRRSEGYREVIITDEGSAGLLRVFGVGSAGGK